MNLDELRSLDIKEVGNWPPAAKLGAMGILTLLILSLAWAFDWSDQLHHLQAGRREEQTLKDTFTQKKHLAVDLAAYKQQYAEVQRSLDSFLKQLPNREEMDQLLSSINQAGVRRGLAFELFRPAKQEIPGDFYAELPITIRVSGNYHNMAQFVSDVGQLPRIVTLDGMNISRDIDGKLTMDATAHTFRYLDEAELAARQKAEADAAKKAKKK